VPTRPAGQGRVRSAPLVIAALKIGKQALMRSAATCNLSV